MSMIFFSGVGGKKDCVLLNVHQGSKLLILSLILKMVPPTAQWLLAWDIRSNWLRGSSSHLKNVQRDDQLCRLTQRGKRFFFLLIK